MRIGDAEKLRKCLALLLLVVAPATSKQRQEILLEHCPQKLLIPLVEARFPGIHLTSHPTMRGFLFDCGAKVDFVEPKTSFRDCILATKNWIPEVDLPPEPGAGQETREILSPRVPAHLWTPYLHYRYPDLIVSVHATDHGFCAIGRKEQVDSTLALVNILEKASLGRAPHEAFQLCSGAQATCESTGPSIASRARI